MPESNSAARLYSKLGMDSFVPAVAKVASLQTQLSSQGPTMRAPEAYPIVNLAIDIQGHGLRGMDKETQQAYMKSVKDRVEMLREQGIPTIWIAMSDSQKLHRANDSRSPDLLQRLDLEAVNPGADEHIFEKRGINGFIDIADTLTSPRMATHMDSQRTDGSSFMSGHFGSSTLADLLRDMGAEHATVMGAMAGFCITANAVGAALKVKSVNIFPDMVIGWSDKNHTNAVWRQDEPEKTAAEIKSALDEIDRDPASYGYEESDRNAVRNAIKRIDITEAGEYIASLRSQASPESAISPPGQTATAVPRPLGLKA